MQHVLINADVFEGLKSLDGESVDCAITSPPYWGLRDYGKEVVSVWGGRKNCRHEWGNEITVKGQYGLNVGFNERYGGSPGQRKQEECKPKELKQGSFCSRCGAWRGQLGLEPHPLQFVEHLVEVFKEVKRVLKSTGTVWLNLGDTYYNAPCGSVKDKDWQRPSRTACNADQASKAFKQKGNWLQPKQLLGMPWRVASALQKDGWILRNALIWFKPNHMPSSVKDRFANGYEFVFLFVKQGKYWFDLDAVREPSKPESIKHHSKYAGKKYAHKGLVEGEAHDLASATEWKHQTPNPAGKNPGDVISTPGGDFELGSQEYADWYLNKRRKQSWHDHEHDAEQGFGQQTRGKSKLKPNYPHPTGKNPGDFWRITTRGFPGAHFAVFPPELPKRCIKAGCPTEVCLKCGKARERITKTNSFITRPTTGSPNQKHKQFNGKFSAGLARTGGHVAAVHETVGWSDCGCGKGFSPGVVLDPFAGSGTVGVVAQELGRSSVQIELKPEYCGMIKKRMKFDVPRLGDMELEFKEIKGERTK